MREYQRQVRERASTWARIAIKLFGVRRSGMKIVKPDRRSYCVFDVLANKRGVVPGF
jgi:hypothetical protein